MKPLFCVAIFLIVNYCYTQTHVPDISIKSSTGKMLNLKEFSKDKTIILNFWATWCVPCINELNAINEVYSEWQKETNVILIAVSIDDHRTISRVLPLANSNNWSYEILFDSNQELKRAFNILNIPHQIAIHNNRIFYRHSGYTNGQENIIINKVREAVTHN